VNTSRDRNGLNSVTVRQPISAIKRTLDGRKIKAQLGSEVRPALLQAASIEVFCLVCRLHGNV